MFGLTQYLYELYKIKTKRYWCVLMETSLILIYAGIGIIALMCEFIDSTLGAGYGTILVPVLMIILSYDLLPIQSPASAVVFYVLITETVTGFLAAAGHHMGGNVSFFEKNDAKKVNTTQVEDKENLNQNTIQNRFKKTENGGTMVTVKDKSIIITQDMKTALILSVCGIIGSIFAALLALNIPEIYVKTYIGSLVTLCGIIVLLKFKWTFQWWKIWILGFISAFNKGMSGGGYGPLITSGQIIADRNPREAVANTSLSEGIVSIAAVIVYIGSGIIVIDWWLFLALFIGTIASIPFAVISVRTIDIKLLQPAVGAVTLLLGLFTILQLFVI